MTWRVFSAVVVSWVICVGSAVRPDDPDQEPLEGNPDAILAGMGGYRVRCADCHGTDGRGVRGPDITQVWNSGRTDEGLFKTIRSGVPNSEMPAFAAPRTSDRDVWQMLAYLKTLAAPAPPSRRAATPRTARRCFARCASPVTRSNGTGGRLGPDLSRIGIRPHAATCWSPAFVAAPRIFAPASSR